MIARCKACGLPFEAKRSTAKYCSGTCRQRAHRMKVNSFQLPEAFGKLEPPTIRRNLTIEELADVVQQAHQTADDLSRASAHAPAPLCLMLRNVAKALNEALVSEGL